MKKPIALLLFAAAAASCTISAIADTATISNANTSANQNVVVETKNADGESVSTDTLYSVTVEFPNLKFIYKLDTAEVVWDTKNHCYTDNFGDPVTGNWNNNDQTVTVYNDSNASVDVSASFSNERKSAEKNNVTATISNGDGTLEAAAGSSRPSLMYTVSVDGAPSTFSSFDLDTMTVYINK